ncbi:MAG TPA: DUF2975 domain-containing protein [Chitinophagaceae bacterium]|nr:DUF2975 domain-containing protein [Chitinophagaceae bacterium]
MNRIIQLILAVVIARYMYGLTMLLIYFPQQFRDFAKNYDNPGGVVNFESTVGLGDLKITRHFYYDSSIQQNFKNTYVGFKSIKFVNTTRNDTPMVNTKTGELVAARYSQFDKYVQVPVSYKKYKELLVMVMAILIIFLLLLIYISVVLFRFSVQIGNKEFFNKANQRRLRIFGGFLILFSILDYTIVNSREWILQKITGYSGFGDLGDFGYSLNLFPYALVSGLLMFIIAEAFSKGQQLQTEQDYTI